MTLDAVEPGDPDIDQEDIGAQPPGLGYGVGAVREVSYQPAGRFWSRQRNEP